MISRTLTLLNFDNFSTSPAPGVTVNLSDEETYFRRWRPALVKGGNIREFLNRYFAPHARLPWSGVATFRASSVINDGLVITGDGLLVGNSLMYPPSCFPYQHSSLKFTEENELEWSIDLPGKQKYLSGTTATFVCDGWQIYGHWLVDVIPRIHRAIESGITIDHFLFAGPARDWQIQILETIGLNISKCHFIDLSKETVECEKLVVTTYDRFNSEIRPELLNIHTKLTKSLANNDAGNSKRLLYVSRGKWGGSRLLTNRTEVDEVFHQAGYEIVQPETYSFADQIRLFASASVVFGECGSGMHNAIFSSRDCRVGLIQSSNNYNFLQAQIALFLEQEIYYVIGTPNDPDSDNFSVDPSDVRTVAQIIKG